MRKYLLAAAGALLCACGEDPHLPAPTGVPVPVEATMLPDGMTAVTRTDENAVRDVNLYLFGPETLHLYAGSPTLRFEAPAGTYTLYAVANAHADLGERSEEQLRAYETDLAAGGDDLPMTACETVRIDASAPTLRVVLRRAAARIACRITVDDAAPDIRLRSVQLRSAPVRCRPFGDEPPTGPQTADAAPVAVPDAEAGSFTTRFYMLPNPRGTVPSIVDQRDKNAENAPDGASYLLIRATRGDKVLLYTVYLGENETSDFNVRANTAHTLDIVIRGDSEVDTRVNGYILSVTDDIAKNALGGYCPIPVLTPIRVTVEGNERGIRFCGTMEILEGDTDKVSFDRQGAGSRFTFDLRNGENIFWFQYLPNPVTAADSRLRYRITLTDEYGYEQEYGFAYRFANYVNVAPAEGGTVTVSGALGSRTAADGSLEVLCRNACTFRAAPRSGYRFAGWYADKELTDKIADFGVYPFTPSAALTGLYPKFERIVTALDTDDKANCYIAPALDARYSFSATYMGNNRATAGITPKVLFGVRAEVIWETGTRRGAVVRDAEYTDGRIVFTTGDTYGNALIALFDKNGDCIWSWHIWVTDYDPQEGTQATAGGDVFMDRNLGAMNNRTSRGCYYQWGRKDPFPYPAAATGSLGQAPVVYADGYRYATTDEGTSYRSVEYAIRHPWEYIPRNDKTATGGYWKTDWVVPGNPNLWGNASGTEHSENARKSIYDPCPPGWRVPDYGAFRDAEFWCSASSPDTYYVLVSAGTHTYYAVTGYCTGGQFYKKGYGCYLWTNAPAKLVDNEFEEHKAADLAVTGTTPEIDPTDRMARDYALPVRCVKE